MDPALIAAFVVLGAIVGFLAGLLGIGGGMTMVPLLTIVFSRQGFLAEHVVHMAVGTATATILFTSISSAREHHRHGAVLWGIVAGMAPGIIVGSLLGPQIVGGMSTSALAAFFGVFVAVSGTQMLVDRKPKPTHKLPGRGGLFAVGGGIGLVSSMVGAGGAFLSVPFMTACNVDIRNCVATSAALGLPIAVAGTIGFVIAGFGETGLPPALDRLRLRARVARDCRRQRRLRTDRSARRTSLAGAETAACVRRAALRSRRVHALEIIPDVAALALRRDAE